MEAEVSEVKDVAEKLMTLMHKPTKPMIDCEEQLRQICQTMKKDIQGEIIESENRTSMRDKETSLDMKSFVKDEIKYLNDEENFHFSDIKSKIAQLDSILNAKANEASAAISELKTDLATQRDVDIKLQENIKSLDDKFARLTKLMIFMSTKLKEEMALNNLNEEELKDEDSLKFEMIDKSTVSHGANNEVSKDNSTNSQQELNMQVSKLLNGSMTTPLSLNDFVKAPLCLNKCVKAFTERDTTAIFYVTLSIRNLLSGPKRPIDKVIEAGLVSELVSLLDIDMDDKPKLQIVAAEALNIVACGTTKQTRAVVDAGAIPHLIRLLESDNIFLVEKCVEAIKNIADCAELRDVVITSGAVQSLTRLVMDLDTEDTFLLKPLLWTISNLCSYYEGEPSSDAEAFKSVVPCLINLLQHTDTDILSIVFHILSDFVERGELTIECY